VNVALPEHGMLAKLAPSNGAFVEVATLGTAALVSYGRCRADELGGGAAVIVSGASQAGLALICGAPCWPPLWPRAKLPLFGAALLRCGARQQLTSPP
jgi:hypothetical protein